MSAETKKVVVIGDGTCGKTCMLVVYIVKKFPLEYIPTVFESYIKETDVDGCSVPLLLMDTSGQEDYKRLRALQYLDTDVFVLCFAIDNRDSFENVRTKWVQEIKPLKVPIILVATKTDLVHDHELGSFVVTTKEAQRMAKKINAAAYLECSAKLNEGIDEVFRTAARVILTTKKPKRLFQCTVM